MKRLLLLVLLPVFSYGQDTLFTKIFHRMPDNIDLVTNATCRTSSGDFFVSGQINYGEEAFLQKLDSVGNEIWIRKYIKTTPQFENFRFQELAETTDGNLVLAGRIHNDTQGMNHSLIIKMDQNGDTLWTGSFPATGSYGVSQSFVKEGNNGDLYLIWSESNVSNLFVAKYNSSGTLQWSNKYPVVDAFQVNGADFYINSNQLYISSFYYSTLSKGALFCIDESGNYQWGKIFDDIHFWDCLIQNNHVNIATRLPGTNEIGVSRLTMSGSLDWIKKYSTTGWGPIDTPLKLSTSLNSGFVLQESSDPSVWSVIFQLDSVGEPIRTAETMMVLTDAFQVSDTGFFLIGNGPMYGIKSNSTPHYGLVKTDSIFNSIDCIWSYPMTTFDLFSPSISNWNTSVSGNVNPTSNKIFYDVFSSLTEPGCVKFLGSIDELNKLQVDLYPNPANDIINMSISVSSEYTIELFDALGRTHVNSKFSGNQLKMDISKLESGMYRYRLVNTEGGTKSGTLIIAK